MDNNTPQNRILDILKERNLSKTDFAELMGTSKQNVNSLLKNPTNAKLQEIAAALGVPMWQLFASPDDVAKDSQSFLAVIFDGKTCYRAFSLAKLREYVDKLSAQEQTLNSGDR